MIRKKREKEKIRIVRIFSRMGKYTRMKTNCMQNENNVWLKVAQCADYTSRSRWSVAQNAKLDSRHSKHIDGNLQCGNCNHLPLKHDRAALHSLCKPIVSHTLSLTFQYKLCFTTEETKYSLGRWQKVVSLNSSVETSRTSGGASAVVSEPLKRWFQTLKFDNRLVEPTSREERRGRKRERTAIPVM